MEFVNSRSLPRQENLSMASRTRPKGIWIETLPFPGNFTLDVEKNCSGTDGLVFSLSSSENHSVESSRNKKGLGTDRNKTFDQKN